MGGSSNACRPMLVQATKTEPGSLASFAQKNKVGGGLGSTRIVIGGAGEEGGGGEVVAACCTGHSVRQREEADSLNMWRACTLFRRVLALVVHTALGLTPSEEERTPFSHSPGRDEQPPLCRISVSRSKSHPACYQSYS